MSDICVSIQKYIKDWEDWGYDWYSGDYEDKSIPIIKKYDKRLLKYLEQIEGQTQINKLKTKKQYKFIKKV